MVDKRRQRQLSEQIAALAAEYIESNSNRQSLITVTHAQLARNLSQATVYLSILPEEKEEEALHFVRRRAGDLRGYIKKHSALRRIPFISIEIDKGEKNRQRIERISHSETIPDTP